ncbi:chaperone DnaK-related protein [Psychromonas ingrahamii 37]|uniref:Chaperone DnaK-related protein n=1 Tax=Psychromonas ingrahamii (strain DSM 17664 / CCUG 51855 / 37) TaxID=357804 RepID=A1SU97_PSYIN|nr:Hsp70 family protein [Psychromonas ingrahamii]ABM03062.1 chaperone DnaK-related protein [Psychromonas ingrahamii 37]
MNETMPNNTQSRYSIGIDLGTTHCVLSYMDLSKIAEDPALVPELIIMPIPQLTQAGIIEEKKQLPSFIYMAHESELNDADIALPWNAQPNAIVGSIARELGSKTAIRLVSSAKSWLCHSGVDRHAAFLPAASPEEVRKISPLDATFEYLNHMRAAWDDKFPDFPLAKQDVTITIPASFDPAARELTAEAAKRVGFDNLTLLEEPQAAVYNWIHACGEAWREQVQVGDIILVVDVGGGTTDLSLIAVTEEEGNLTLNRIAVGEHILLGGDNMDLALAYRVKAKLSAEGKELQAWQIQAISQACRDAKEQLLLDNDISSVPITVPSRGSKLLGKTLRTELTRNEVRETLLEGFFPVVNINDHPKAARRSGLTQKGLPYAQDPAVSRHLAAFLSKQVSAADDVLGSTSLQSNNEDFADPLAGNFDKADSVDFIKPSAILFNGGVLKSPLLAERTMATINQWLEDAGAEKARLLADSDLDLAVASGASYYGYVKRGQGVRIRGGLANTYYVGIESSMPAIPGMEPPLEALCIAPFGMEEGTETVPSEAEFGLVVGEPVRFRFFGSNIRRHDQAGLQLEHWIDDELQELPELQATLSVEGRRVGDVVPVRLQAKVTEVGTLQLEAIAVNSRETNGSPERWHIELDVRD